ncbi:uncharacterized protein BO97DRAFT_97103 [Aspergillus homomorphus CBS 101889]|uniref:Uncharacterized protein n=1 Tax=Aspergillus homomorphus (strain CBS 101889) TaxID=1450537 RepID=A0A395HUP5_ASPHC|nr:hypothetical protein BO97DRAFT_97103 [Aspergillus homomorphus CBS 101889]RAL11520.1 hypothetical protein BO97DRAFT_97103 [Aspergillus homomorphus CBS 101889]
MVQFVHRLLRSLRLLILSVSLSFSLHSPLRTTLFLKTTPDTNRPPPHKLNSQRLKFPIFPSFLLPLPPLLPLHFQVQGSLLFFLNSKSLPRWSHIPGYFCDSTNTSDYSGFRQRLLPAFQILLSPSTLAIATTPRITFVPF